MGINDTFAAAVSDLREYLIDPEYADANTSTAMAVYVLMQAALYADNLTSPPDLPALLAGDTSHFDDPVLAKIWTRQEGTPIPPQARAALVTFYTAVAQAMHLIQHEVIPLLGGALRPLTPEGEAEIDQVLDAHRTR